VRQLNLDYLQRAFGNDAELLAKMTPDFMVMGKRPIRDPADFGPGSYFWALAQPNAEVETAQPARIVPEGIITSDGRLVELDVIVYATGLTLDFVSTIDIVGRDGVRLVDMWKDNNPRSYLGGTVPGFPNLFVSSGPNTGSGHAGGHNFFAETQAHYTLEAIQLAVDEDATMIETTEVAFHDHNEALDERMAGSIWAVEHRAHTYYRNAQGRIIMVNPWTLTEFWEMSRSADRGAFKIS
jgi:4-hydroxyacetophenone monooxygenase